LRQAAGELRPKSPKIRTAPLETIKIAAIAPAHGAKSPPAPSNRQRFAIGSFGYGKAMKVDLGWGVIELPVVAKAKICNGTELCVRGIFRDRYVVFEGSASIVDRQAI
jgi:hypothetical protein